VTPEPEKQVPPIPAVGAPPEGAASAGGPLPVIHSAAYRELPDASLVVRTQRGDTRAFDELVRRYRDKVYRLAFKILRHEDDAAEALQDAFMSAFRGLKNFKAESTFSTWLYRITTNAALMKYRKRREGHVSLEQSQSRDDDLQPIELADWSQIPDDQLEDRETWQVLVDAVEQLPEDLKVVFFRRDWLEESNAEVADALSLSVAAVKSRLHRARIQLRDRLNRYFAGKLARRGRELSRRGEDE